MSYCLRNITFGESIGDARSLFPVLDRRKNRMRGFLSDGSKISNHD